MIAIFLSVLFHCVIIFSITQGQGTKTQRSLASKTLNVSLAKVNLTNNQASQSIQQKAPSLESLEAEGDKNQSNSGGTILIPEEPYYRAKELDTIPQPLHTITPTYPDTVPASVKEGRVKLEIKIDQAGSVTDLRVLESEPSGYFEDAAIEAFKDAQFLPGIKAGKNVKTLLIIQVRFRAPLSD